MAEPTRRAILRRAARLAGGAVCGVLAAGLSGCGLATGQRQPRSGGALSLLADTGLLPAASALAAAYAAAGGAAPAVEVAEPSLGSDVQEMLAGEPGISPDCIFATPAVRDDVQALSLLSNVGPALAAAGLGAALYPACVQYGQSGGRQLLVPAFRDPLVVYYNADALAQAGLNPPRPGWTLTDLGALCARLRARDAPLAAPLANVLRQFDLELFTAFVVGFGGAMVRPAQVGYVPRFSSPAGAAATAALAALHAFEPASGTAAPRDLFTSGRAALYFGHHRDLAPVAAAIGGLFAWDVAPLPVFPARSAQPVTADGLAVTTQDPARRTAAVALALFAASPQGQEALARSGTGVPALRALAASPTWRAAQPAVHLDVFVSDPGADIVVDLPLHVVAPVLAAALDAVVAGTPAATALAEAATVAEYQLATWQG